MTAAVAPPSAALKPARWARVLLPAALVALLAVAVPLTLTARRQGGAPAAYAPAVAPAPAAEAPCSCAAAAAPQPFASDGLSELTGTVSDCCCEYETLDALNQEVLHPLLSSLAKQPFFRYFKVNLYCDCPFWPDDGMCALPDCSVCECPPEEVPLSWRTPATPEEEAAVPVTAGSADCAAATAGSEEEARLNAREGVVDRTLDVGAEFRAWRELDNPWTADDEAGADLSYVNLALNPERYTGYAGEHAHRVWRAIYEQPCFDGVAAHGSATCAAGGTSAAARQDLRMFYRLISGLHASISTHIAAEYLVDPARGVWGTNVPLWHERVGAYRDRQENLYFVTLFVLRAVLKAGDFLLAADYRTGAPEADALTALHMRQLVESPALRAACPVPFDEARLLQGKDGLAHKEELRAHFRNISSVMDCVGCEKCRLWGKLQTLGLGTALKILFSLDPGSACPELQRNEVIALINLLHRLSESVKTNREFGAAWRSGAVGPVLELQASHPALPTFLGF